jgi:multidrug resistance efflux pump
VYLSLGMGLACAPTRIGIAPQVSGPVVELPVVDNQHVQGDDLLLEVGPRRCQRALDKLEPSLRWPR